MADKPASSNRSAAQERQERLAQNLRANLKRRKQQSRERQSTADAPKPTSDDEPVH